MKTCPNCQELLGDNAIQCFKCFYDFNLRKIVTKEESKKYIEEREKEEKELAKKEDELISQKENERIAQIQKNAVYEYETVIVPDLKTGEADVDGINSALKNYSKEGWKLHTILTNEVGKSTSIKSAIWGIMENATIDQTILVFERCIRDKL